MKNDVRVTRLGKALLLMLGLGLLQPLTAKADLLYQLYWRGTYYTTSSTTGHIIAVPFTEQDVVNQIAQNNGLDPATCILVYRPLKRDTAVVRSNGAFVADFIQMQYVYTDVNNPWKTVTVRQALLNDEYHQNAIGSWMGLELRTFDASNNLTNDQLTGWMQYSLPESNAVYGGSASTGRQIVDTTNAP
ncbi:MAG: hypothetical protein ACREIC_02095 [Limisphaerales bacterium]